MYSSDRMQNFIVLHATDLKTPELIWRFRLRFHCDLLESKLNAKLCFGAWHLICKYFVSMWLVTLGLFKMHGTIQVMLNAYVSTYRTKEISHSTPKTLCSQSNESLCRFACSLTLEVLMLLFHCLVVLVWSVVW